MSTDSLNFQGIGIPVFNVPQIDKVNCLLCLEHGEMVFFDGDDCPLPKYINAS
jgi:hypothetical protein